MNRRDILRGGLALPWLTAAAPAMAAPPANAAPPAGATPFDAGTVRNLARALALQPYKAPDTTLPDSIKDLDYQQYRSIRFKPDKALWSGQDLGFTAEFFHLGFLYKERVDIYEVANGHAQPVHYSSDLFTFDKMAPPPGDIGFAGFRLHYPLNRPDVQDEVCAFLGASYFRAVAKGQGYGMSARGLAIKTADPGGEEFPIFKAFWLERPQSRAGLMVVYALLDSPSAAGAFRFTIRPGQETLFDTETVLYPRVDIPEAGLAPLTSMFLFDVNDRGKLEDWRQAVHDSSGLQLHTGHDDQIWRPLTNPHTLQVSAFADTSPRGFGLMQRERTFADYQDLESRYEKRPAVWVEPIGDWGQGVVELVEIPSDREVNDNIVAFWRPNDPLRAKSEVILSYRLHWCWATPGPVTLAQVMQTRCGQSWDQKHRQFVIDYVGDALKPFTTDKPPALDVGCSKGQIVNATAEPNPDISGWRISIELDAQSNNLVELHARLLSDDKPVTETWIYRWTSS